MASQSVQSKPTDALVAYNPPLTPGKIYSSESSFKVKVLSGEQVSATEVCTANRLSHQEFAKGQDPDFASAHGLPADHLSAVTIFTELGNRLAMSVPRCFSYTLIDLENFTITKVLDAEGNFRARFIAFTEAGTQMIENCHDDHCVKPLNAQLPRVLSEIVLGYLGVHKNNVQKDEEFSAGLSAMTKQRDVCVSKNPVYGLDTRIMTIQVPLSASQEKLESACRDLLMVEAFRTADLRNLISLG